MLEIYRTKNENVHKKVEILLTRKLGNRFEIKTTANGKPYIDGNPLYFSLSHSENRAVIAVCDKPVGIDIENYEISKNYSSVLSRFTGREKKAADTAARFYENWVAKEAFIKMRGGTLAHDLKKLEYFDKSLYYDGKMQSCGLAVFDNGWFEICAVCAEGYTEERLLVSEIKLFRLRKGERI